MHAWISLPSSNSLPCSEDMKSAGSGGARSNSPDEEDGHVEGSSQQEDSDTVEQSPQPSEHGTAGAEGLCCPPPDHTPCAMQHVILPIHACAVVLQHHANLGSCSQCNLQCRPKGIQPAAVGALPGRQQRRTEGRVAAAAAVTIRHQVRTAAFTHCRPTIVTLNHSSMLCMRHSAEHLHRWMCSAALLMVGVVKELLQLPLLSDVHVAHVLQ